MSRRLTGLMASGVYEVPRIEIETRAVVTNTTPTGAVRGAGRPEATQVIERAIAQRMGRRCRLAATFRGNAHYDLAR